MWLRGEAAFLRPAAFLQCSRRPLPVACASGQALGVREACTVLADPALQRSTTCQRHVCRAAAGTPPRQPHCR